MSINNHNTCSKEVVPSPGAFRAACWGYACYGSGSKELTHSILDFTEIVVQTQKADINERIM